MSKALHAVCGAVVLSLFATPALALEAPGVGLSPAAQRAVSLAQTPIMTEVREFTVIPTATSAADLKTLETYFAGFGFRTRESANLKHLILTGTLADAGNAAHMSFSSFSSHGEVVVRATPLRFPPSIARLIAATSFVPGAHARPLSI